jgi:hypothetical protein
MNIDNCKVKTKWPGAAESVRARPADCGSSGFEWRREQTHVYIVRDCAWIVLQLCVCEHEVYPSLGAGEGVGKTDVRMSSN